MTLGTPQIAQSDRRPPATVSCKDETYTRPVVVRIENAASYPQYIETVARWHWEAWGAADPDGSVETWTAGLRTRTNRQGVPMTLLAIDDRDQPIGSVTLVTHDMPDRYDLQHLTPWIAGTFVIATERGKEVGSALMSAAATEAVRLGIERLFLYTSTARSFYERLGWTVMRDDYYEGESVAIMETRLS